ncbi:glycosyltransferase [Telmatospirillum sp.]|uniref:glycosyltransferase n=1 Tax=Telmatospirillum sp. TaxID=2079197 RepID=UPI0028472A9A|nr:glycosyltransferase [Telmatospirillum sp.]MDR3435592.1 glycosyltransferase [Telmatospirillum sp.]
MMLHLQKAADLVRAGRLDEAEALCNEVLRQGNDGLAHYILGLIFSERGNHENATGHFAEVVALHPENPDYRHILGLSLSQQGKIEEALDSLDAAVDLRLFFPEAHAEISALLARRAKASQRYGLTVVTPTIGTANLARALASVQAQSYPRIEHLVVVDGPQGAAAVKDALPDNPRHPVQVLPLPFNTGAGGYNGHRIYAASAFLASGRYIAFLDEDNAWEPDHASSLMDLIERSGVSWAHSLRSLVDQDGRTIGLDDCESLGRWPTWDNPNVHLVDMNCYILRRDLAMTLAPILHRRCRDQEAPDIALCRALMDQAPAFGCSGRYSVRYTVGGSEISVRAPFFEKGNAVMRERHPGRFPWQAPI